MLLALALAAAVAASDPSPTPAAGAAPAPATAPNPPKKPDRKHDPNRVVCEDASDVGSMIPHRVCHTQAEWDARSEHDRATTSSFQNDHANN